MVNGLCNDYAACYAHIRCGSTTLATFYGIYEEMEWEA